MLAGTGLALLTGDALRLVLAAALALVLDRKARGGGRGEPQNPEP